MYQVKAGKSAWFIFGVKSCRLFMVSITGDEMTSLTRTCPAVHLRLSVIGISAQACASSDMEAHWQVDHIDFTTSIGSLRWASGAPIIADVRAKQKSRGGACNKSVIRPGPKHSSGGLGLGSAKWWKLVSVAGIEPSDEWSEHLWYLQYLWGEHCSHFVRGVFVYQRIKSCVARVKMEILLLSASPLNGWYNLLKYFETPLAGQMWYRWNWNSVFSRVNIT